MTSPIEYLVSQGFIITSNPSEYYDSYNPCHPTSIFKSKNKSI